MIKAPAASSLHHLLNGAASPDRPLSTGGYPRAAGIANIFPLSGLAAAVAGLAIAPLAAAALRLLEALLECVFEVNDGRFLVGRSRRGTLDAAPAGFRFDQLQHLARVLVLVRRQEIGRASCRE